MKIDERIKEALEGESAEIDAILQQREGMVDMVLGAFSAGLGRWVILLNAVTLVVTGLMFWTGFRFFTATTPEDQLYWGVCVVLAAMVQIACKQWVMQEMNRGSLLREIKRLEGAVLRLTAKLES